MKQLFILVCFFLFFLSATNANESTKVVYKKPFKMGWMSLPYSLDPQFQSLTPNNMFSRHIFDSLYYLDKTGRIQSDLVENTTNTSSKHWIVTLKKNIKFHNGKPLTSDDIIYTLDRIYNKPAPNGQFLSFLNGIKYKKLDTHKIQFETIEPSPFFQLIFMNIFILQANDDGFKTKESFETGESLIGTGPYQYIKGTINEQEIHLKAFKDYHGKKPYLQHVIIKGFDSDKERLQALKQKQLDFIDQITPDNFRDLKMLNHIRLTHLPGNRLMHLFLDQENITSPFIVSNDDKALTQNPLNNLKVRKALSIAIDRNHLVSNVLNGAGEATHQFTSVNTIEFNPAINEPPYDKNLSKRLLKEAGYPNGFKIKLHGPNDRYIQDREIVQSIAKMWSSIGIETEVHDLPKSEYFPKANNGDFSTGLLGFAPVGGSRAILRFLIATQDTKNKNGVFNHGRYSNPELDKLISKIHTSFNPGLRQRTIRIATEMAISDQAIIPLYIENLTWGIRKDMDYRPQIPVQISAYSIFPIPSPKELSEHE